MLRSWVILLFIPLFFSTAYAQGPTNGALFPQCAADTDCVVFYNSYPCPGLVALNKNYKDEAITYWKTLTSGVECTGPSTPPENASDYEAYCWQNPCKDCLPDQTPPGTCKYRLKTPAQTQ